MRSEFLLPETIARDNGVGAEIALIETGRSIQLTLGITRSMAQESLDVSIWGSPDGQRWRQVAVFPQKFYCGTYSQDVDLTRHPDVRFLRAQWKMGRWRREETAPLFEFYVLAVDGPIRQYAGAA